MKHSPDSQPRLMVALGIVVGAGLGIVLGQAWLGLPIGLVTGVALGAVVGAALMSMLSKRR